MTYHAGGGAYNVDISCKKGRRKGVGSCNSGRGLH